MREREPGVWQLRVSDGNEAINGKRRVITETVHGSKRAAKQRLAELEVSTGRGSHHLGRQTLGAVIRAWRADSDHASTTMSGYDLAVRTIPDHLLATPIERIRAVTLNELYRQITATIGADRARRVHAVISGALTYAWQQEWILGNVARRARPPVARKRKSTAPTPTQVRRLLDTVAAQPEMYAWLLLAITAGGRRGELLALRWSDIDLERGQVSIDKALDPIHITPKATKTDTERTIAIGPDAVNALVRWRLAFKERALAVGAKPVRDPYVFTNDMDGRGPWRPDQASKRFRTLADQAGVACRLHDLRHYMATSLLAAGVPTKVVADRAGHSRESTTTDLYGHPVPESDRAAATTMERGLNLG